MIPLRHSTANQHIALGYFLDATDGNTEETASTISVLAGDIRLWKHGLNTIATKNSGAATPVAGNVWKATFDGIDSNTIGPLQIFAHPTGALALELQAMVYPTSVYDADITGTDIRHVDVQQWRGSTLNALISGRVDANIGGATTSINASVAINSVIQADIVRVNNNASAAARLSSAFDPAASVAQEFGIIDRGTAQTVGSNFIAMRTGASFSPSVLAGAALWIFGSTNGRHERKIVLNNTSSVLTVDPWIETPTGTISYELLATPPGPVATLPLVNVAQWNNASVATPNIAGRPVVDLALWRGSSVNELISGKVDAAASAGGTVTVSSILAGVIQGPTFSSGAITAIQNGLATSTQVASTLNASVGFWRGSTVNALVSGRISSFVGEMASTVLTAASTTAGFVSAIQAGIATIAGTSVIEARLASVLRADVSRWLGATPATPNVSGVVVSDTAYWRGSAVNELIGGKVDAAASAGGTVTVSSILAGVITPSAYTAGAITALQAGIATTAQVASTLNAQVASAVNAVVSSTVNAVVSSTVNAQVSSTVNANISSIAGVTVTGSGTSGDPWGP
jgi:hypothetical protein